METLCRTGLELASHQAEEAPAQAIEPLPNLGAIGFAEVAPGNRDPERRMGLQERAPSGFEEIARTTRAPTEALGDTECDAAQRTTELRREIAVALLDALDERTSERDDVTRFLD